LLVYAEREILDEVLDHFIQFEPFLLSRIGLNGSWLMKIDTYENGLLNEYYSPYYEPTDWSTIQVPFQMIATYGNSTIWLRKEFKVSPDLHGKRLRLVFWGSWIITDVWLNGRYLGRHEGYFSPFYFDVSDVVRFDDVNVLVVCVRSPIEENLRTKKLLEGVFTDSDIKPYPSWALGRLPYRLERIKPIGLWRGVELLVSEDITIDLTLVDTSYDRTNDIAYVKVKLLLNNRGYREADISVTLEVRGYNFESKSIKDEFSLTLDAGERKWVERTITIEEPKLWWSWDYGEPNLYELHVKAFVDDILQGEQTTIFGIREFKADLEKYYCTFTLNGKKIFLRGGAYVSEFLLIRSNRSLFEKDLSLFEEAGINFIRVYAHVEPFEFYRTTDERGFMVMAESPLIGLYAEDLWGDEYELFKRSAIKQIVEMVLLLYNNPSVVMWSLHERAPWAVGAPSKAGYRLKRLVEMAANTIRLLGDARPILLSSGHKDSHIFYGWKEGSWLDFRRLEVGFLSEFGAQSLPSANSPFWRLVKVEKWPIREGEPLFYEFMFRGFNPELWSSYGVGLPEDYECLEDFIEASQLYQARILKVAIEHMRLLKFNVSGGVCIFTLTDMFPAISYSIIDYYRVPKIAYDVVKMAYNPTHIIVDWRGDYGTRLYDVVYDGLSPITFDLWIVNDDPEAPQSAILRWYILDEDENKTLASDSLEISIPRAEEPARRVSRIDWRPPIFVDKDHRIVLRTELWHEDKLIDVNELEFIVRSSSRVVLKLLNIEQDLDFIAIVQGLVRRVRSHNGLLEIAVTRGTSVSIAGPIMEGNVTYVPFILDLGTIEEPLVERNITLIKGAAIILKGVYPPLEAREPSEVNIKAVPEVNFSIPLILERTEATRRILHILGVKGYSLIVPLNVSFTLLIDIRRGAEHITSSVGPMTLDTLGPHYIEAVSLKIARRDFERVLSLYKGIVEDVNVMRERGFYLGFEVETIRSLNTTLAVTEDLLKVNNTDEAEYNLKYVYTMVKDMEERLGMIMGEARLTFPLMFLITFITLAGLASVVSESAEGQVVLVIAGFVVLQTVIYRAFPMAGPVSMADIATIAYLFMIFLFALYLLPNLLEGIKTEKGIPLFSAISMALSMAARNLRRRRLRTVLALIAISSMAIAMTNLLSIMIIVSPWELVTTTVNPPSAPNILLVFKSRGALELADIEWIAAQPEVAEMAIKVESMPQPEPLGTIDTFPILGFVGLSKHAPVLEKIKPLVYPPDALDTLLNEDYTVLLAKSVAQGLDLRIGDIIVIRGSKLRIVGYFDASQMVDIFDVGGYTWLPFTILPGSPGPAVVSPEHLILVNDRTALALGGSLTKVYVYTRSPEDALKLARRLSLLTPYVVYVAPSGMNSRVFVLGRRYEVKGSVALIPFIIAALNIGSIVLASVYERRREIFTLACVGLNPTHIFLVFLSEALVLGMVGGSLGFLISIILFRVMDIASIIVPVDIKIGLMDALMVIMTSTAISIVSGVLPALMASKLATPSLRRRWKLEAEVIREGWWIIDIPARIPREKADSFIDYVYWRLRELEGGIEVSVSRVYKGVEELISRRIHWVEFLYSRGGGRPFNAVSRLEVEESATTDFCKLTLKIRTSSPYGKVNRSQAYEVANFIRTVTLEWASLRVRLMAPLGRNIEPLVEAIRHYRPQLVVIFSRYASSRDVRELKRRLILMGVRPPAVEFVRVGDAGLDELVTAMVERAKEVDTVFIESDDGLLSVASTMAAMMAGRRICILRRGKLEEMTPEKLARISEGI